MSDEMFIMDQYGCARCGADEHLEMVYKPFTSKPELFSKGGGMEVTHWALCPINGEPILLMTGPSDDE